MGQSALPNKRQRPLIKWTGGKYDEFGEFAHLIPSFNNYYEPFFGGGGVFFALQPKGISFLNDKSTDLITFYKLIKEPAVAAQLNQYAQAWQQATMLSKKVAEDLVPGFIQFADNKTDMKALHVEVVHCIGNIDENEFAPLFETSFIDSSSKFKAHLIHSLHDKFRRIKSIQAKEKRAFTREEMKEHAETAVKSGLYLFLRSIMNKAATGEVELTREKATANWYFIREFCYASMFRYNSKGEFNIPYGGIAYNKKDLKAKVNAITSHTTRQLFNNSFFYNLDFAEFLVQVNPAEDDFVFLDPPYDSEFSEYDQNAFTQQDQVRLKDAIMKCKANCMVVIKETDFIRNLYNSSHFNIVEFDKMYTYNVRGRNNRGTNHLIILNYHPPQQKHLQEAMISNVELT